MKYSNSLIALLALLTAGCASTDPYEKKMERYTARSGEKILVPEMKAASIPFSAPKPSRLPASASNEAITNKKLYFLSLYAQYDTLKNITHNPSASDVALCPSFHTGLITYQESHQNSEVSSEKKYNYNQSLFSDEKYVSMHPELFLPVSKEGTTPRVIDILRGMKTPSSDSAVAEIIDGALNIHLAKTYTELRELCDFGSSSNYYIYENLITHIKNHQFKASTDSMNILLKTTLFSNRALITSLSKDKTVSKGRSIASEKANIPYTDEVVSRLNVPWANEYFRFIKENK